MATSLKVPAARANTAVVLGQSATALFAIRELGRAGFVVYGEPGDGGPAAGSRYLSHVASEVAQTEEQRLHYLLDRLPLDGPHKAVLIPCSDQDVDFVSRNALRLADKYMMQPALQDGMAVRLMDKESLYALCRDHGILVPGCWTLERHELEGLLDQLSFPCLIKPSLIHEVKQAMAGRKLWTVSSPEAYRELVGRLPDGNTRWIVQEIIPGPESEIWLYCGYFDATGRPHQQLTARKLRQYPPGFGSASLVRTESNEILRQLCADFFAAVGYRGIATAEFKRDPRDGKLRIIEVNPRPSLWFGVSSAAGKRIVLAACMDALRQPLPEDVVVPDGVYWRYFMKDIYSRVFYALNPGFILPPPQGLKDLPVQTSTGAVYASDDRWPMWGELTGLLRKLFVRLFRRVAG